MIAEVSAIVARGMGVRRGGRWLLRPAAFGVAGGVVGLAGPPGAGKTTLLATFATLRRPHVGALEVLGCDAGNSGGLREIRARVGYLPSGGLGWAASLRVREFVAYAAFYKRMEKSAVVSILARMELTEVAEWELGRLPADIGLRAGLAAACVHDPDLLLLDEPLRGLDERQAMELSTVLPSLAPTVLLTAESPDDLAGWCDRVLTLARGRLTEITSPQYAPSRPHHPATAARASTTEPTSIAAGTAITGADAATGIAGSATTGTGAAATARERLTGAAGPVAAHRSAPDATGPVGADMAVGTGGAGAVTTALGSVVSISGGFPQREERSNSGRGGPVAPFAGVPPAVDRIVGACAGV